MTPVTADDLWVDVGAESAEDVASMGINLLDPISRHLPPWPVAGGVAGPDAGRRVGCGAVTTLANQAEGDLRAGETYFVLSSQQVFGWVGLSSFIAREGNIEEVVVVAPGESLRTVEQRSRGDLGRFGGVLESMGVSSVHWIAPEVRSPGSHMEVIRSEEAEFLIETIAQAVGMTLPRDHVWSPAPSPGALRSDYVDPAMASAADLLTDLVELQGVSSHEWAVRRYVLEALPDWARELAGVDDVGNHSLHGAYG